MSCMLNRFYAWKVRHFLRLNVVHFLSGRCSTWRAPFFGQIYLPPFLSCIFMSIRTSGCFCPIFGFTSKFNYQYFNLNYLCSTSTWLAGRLDIGNSVFTSRRVHRAVIPATLQLQCLEDLRNTTFYIELKVCYQIIEIIALSLYHLEIKGQT